MLDGVQGVFVAARAKDYPTLSPEIATDTPFGCFGIGGAPGESVYIKAGVSEKEGDVLDVVVWPARDGSPEGVLSAFTNDGVYTLIHEEVRQRSANEAADAAEAAGN